MNSSEITVKDLNWDGWGMDVTKSAEPDDVMYISSLKFALQGMGENFSKIYIAGISGACFYIGWNSQSLYSGMGGSTYMFPKVGLKVEAFKKLSQGIGRECTVIQKDQLSKMWELIQSSIDKKHPVIACEWKPNAHRGHFSIIYGYEGENSLLLKSYGEGIKYVTEPKNLHYILCFGSLITTKPSRKKIVIDSIKLGINLLDFGLFRDEETAIYGINAYESQKNLVLDSLAPNVSYYPLLMHFMNWRNTVTWLSRNYAYQFLSEIGSLFKNPVKGHILKACDLYLEYGKNWQNFYKTCKIPSEYEPYLKHFLSESPNRIKYGKFLEHLQKIEIDALKELKSVIATLPSSE